MINETSAGIVIYYEPETKRETEAKRGLRKQHGHKAITTDQSEAEVEKTNEAAGSQHMYLLLHYPGGHFDFPKGHIEKGESEKQAALRELMEETGIKKITWIPGFREKIRYRYLRGKKYSTKEVIFFLARAVQKKITISFEHQGSVWLPYKEALKKTTYRQAKNILKKAEDYLEHCR